MVEIIDNYCNIEKIHRKESGLTIYHLPLTIPLSDARIVVRTCGDGGNQGYPHCLEHLIFLGSEEHPYKGAMDRIANRSLANGTNAYTCTTHTVYTISCAGQEGFLRMLPVYLDHVLFPTLTKEAFTTEIHHIDGEGKDQGVVYVEMQAIQNNASNLVYRVLLETLFEGTYYADETGGKVEDLRNITVEQIRSFHQKYYRPDNISIVVSGDMTLDEILKSIEPIEKKIVKNASQLPPFKNPWSEKLPPFKESVIKKVDFPSESDDETGVAIIATRSLKWTDFFAKTAFAVLTQYLNDTSASPLKKDFIYRDDGPISGSVSSHFIEGQEMGCCFSFTNTPVKNLEKVLPTFRQCLQKVIAEGIDLERMEEIIFSKRLSLRADVESNPDDVIGDELIEEFVFGENNVNDVLSIFEHLDELEDKTEKYWEKLLTDFLNDPYVCVLGYPKKELGETLKKNESDRLIQQKKSFGEEKLKECEEVLRHSEKVNSKLIPLSTYDSFPVPSSETISRVPLLSIQDGKKFWSPSKGIKKENEVIEKFSKQEHPFFIQFNHVKSEFVRCQVYMDTAKLDPHLRKYLELYLEVIFDLPIMRDGVLIPHEEVVQQLNAEAVDFSSACGLHGGNFTCGAFAQLAALELKFEKEEYLKMIQWMKELLWYTQLDKKQVKMAASTLLTSIDSKRRKPSAIGSSALKFINFDPLESNHNACNFSTQEVFLKSIVKRLKSNEADKVLEELNEVRRLICHPNNLRINVSGDFLAISDEFVDQPWSENFLPSDLKMDWKTPSLPSPFKTSAELKIPKKHPNCLFTKDAFESSYLFQSIDGLVSNHEDLVALNLLLEYLTTLESVMWIRIRGKGLSYGYELFNSSVRGLIIFTLSRCGDALAAWREVKKIVKEFKTGELKFEKERFEEAKSSYIFQTISKERSPHSKASSFFVQSSFSKCSDILAKIDKVQLEDMDRVFKQYLVDLFDPAKFRLVLVGPTNSATNLIDGFQQEGVSIKEQDITNFFLE